MKTIEIDRIEVLKEFLETCENGTVITLIIEGDDDGQDD